MAKKSKPEAASSLLADAFTAADLMEEFIPELQYVVEGVVPEGLTLLIAAPKIGKSWMVLAIALDVASGRPTFGGIPTCGGPVLYMALEDGKRRLQDRMGSIGVRTFPQRLVLKINAHKEDILDTIREFIESNAGQNPLVILDTLGRVMPPQEKGETLYDRDYRIGAALKSITDDFPGSAIIVVHHTRKAVTEDFTESSSGTNGLTGSADTILVLRRVRHENTATLHVTSRDAIEGEYRLNFGTNGRWTFEGGSIHEASEAARAARDTQKLGDQMLDVVREVTNYPDGIKADGLADLLDMTVQNARVYLKRAHDADRIRKIKRGLYGPILPSSPTFVPSDSVIEVDFSNVEDRPFRPKRDRKQPTTIQ